MIEEAQPSRTPLSQLGEFGLIEHITENITFFHESTKLGVGDDAAVFDHGSDYSLVSTDMLVEGVHFDLSYTPLKHLGYKAAMVNFSDIYAMGGLPKQIVVGLALSNRFPVEAIEELYEGIRLACQRHEVDLVGGDTTSSTSGLIISITAMGAVAKDALVKRSGAQAKDLIVVSGDLGGAYMGLQLLEREKQVYLEHPTIQPDLAGHEYVLERQLKPEARRDIIKMLNEMEVQPTSMIDISDGLSSELLHLSKASGLGCHIFENKIPLDPDVIRLSEIFKINPITAALNGGEDYELLFTIAQADYDKIKHNPNLTPIGYMTEASAGCVITLNEGTDVALKAQGFNHMTDSAS